MKCTRCLKEARKNGAALLVSSDRNNRTNLFGVDLASGAIEQLTDLDPVPPPRELQFLTACLNPARDEVYFWHDLKLVALDLQTRRTRTLCELEPKWCISMTSCSSDGGFVYFACWEDQSANFRTDINRGYIGFEETWAAHPLSWIVRVAVDTAAFQVVHEDKNWIGHVNTSPTLPNLLTFCHEGPWDKADHRIWALDAQTGFAWKVRPTTGGEVVGHEYWYQDGVHIGYHGNIAGQPMLGRIRYDNADAHECLFPAYTGHIFSHDAELIVGDGGGVIRLWRREGDRYTNPRVLCEHGSAMRIQQTHPHPRISPDGKYVVFSSDRTGYGNVYSAPLADFGSLPNAVD